LRSVFVEKAVRVVEGHEDVRDSVGEDVGDADGEDVGDPEVDTPKPMVGQVNVATRKIMRADIISTV